MAKPTRFITAADRAAAGQPTTVDLTVQCELGNHAKCRGTVFSLTASNGVACLCDCHDDAARDLEGALEERHFGRLFAYDL